RRAARRGPPVLRRHPGPPGAEEPAHPAAPAVRRVRAGRRVLPGRGPAAGADRGAGGHLMAAATGSEPHEYEVLGSEEIYSGRVISLRRDTVAMPGGGA